MPGTSPDISGGTPASLQRRSAIALCVALFGAVVVAQYFSPAQLTFAPFYTIPVIWATCLLGRAAGFGLSAVAVAVSLAIQMKHGGLQSSRIWNAGMEL